jgi:putative ABC transport system substrate-binding protein
MKRRQLIALLSGAAVAWPFAALAQQPARMRRVGVITGMQETDPQWQLNVQAFLKGLSERGLNDGRNLQLDIRFGANNAENIRLAVASILANSPEVILAQGTTITGALRQQTQIVPVVFTVVSDPVGSGFVQSFAHPGGNLTGFTNFLEPSLAAKWVELLKEIAPGVSRVGILYNPQLAAGGGLYFAQPVETSAVALGVQSVRLPVQTPDDIEQAIEKFARESGGGLISPPDSTTLAHRDLILALERRGTACLLYIPIVSF